jgi:phosphatidylinositol alpha-1,6-mannosyltransferase
MKPLLFTIDYPPQVGGVANYYELLVKHWPAGENLAVLDNVGGKLVDAKLSFFKWRPGFRALSRAVKEQGIDHIIVGQLLPLGTVAWLKAKGLGCTYSVVLHGMDLPFALRSARKRWLAKRILGQAEKIICTNSYVASLAKLLIADQQKIVVITPGVSAMPRIDSATVSALRDRYQLPGKKVMLSVGRLVKRKGVDQVIKTLPFLMERFDNLIYVIAGTGGDEAYLKELAAALPAGMQERIHFVGKVQEAEKWAWFDLCDLFIMPSRDINGDFEGFGIVYLEANLAGKPVIAGRSGGVPDAVISDLNGLLVTPESLDEIRQAIQTLIQDPAYAAKLGAQGRERTQRHFAWSDKAKQFHDALLPKA